MSRDYVGVCGISYAYLFINPLFSPRAMPYYSRDYNPRSRDGKSITTEFLFPYLRYILSLCAQKKLRLRGRPSIL